MIYLEGELEEQDTYLIIDPTDPTRRKIIYPKDAEAEILLKPIFVAGRQVYNSPTLHEIRQKTLDGLSHFDRSNKRLTNPHIYPVGLEESLYDLRTELVLSSTRYQDVRH